MKFFERLGEQMMEWCVVYFDIHLRVSMYWMLFFTRPRNQEQSCEIHQEIPPSPDSEPECHVDAIDRTFFTFWGWRETILLYSACLIYIRDDMREFWAYAYAEGQK